MAKYKKKIGQSVKRKFHAQQKQMMEIGVGPYMYPRIPIGGGGTIFRFQTRAEADAAMRKGMELDHIVGSPPHVVEAILDAAAAAKQ